MARPRLRLRRAPETSRRRAVAPVVDHALLRRQLREAIVASAIGLSGESAADYKATAQPWQAEALGYRNKIGAVRYASDFYARPLRRLRLFVGEIDPVDGKIKATEDAAAIAVLDRFQDPGGGRTNLMTQYGRLLFTTGETIAVGEKNPVTGRDQWEMLSPLEIQKQQDGYVRFRDGGSKGEPVSADATIIRLWARDPTYSNLADSPLRAVLDTCEEIAMQTLVIRARMLSRLSGNGILFVPDEITIPGVGNADENEEHDDNLEEDPFFDALIKAMLSSIEDLGNASAVVPTLMRGPADAGEQIRHIPLRDSGESFPEIADRQKSIERLGVELDMPPEALTGVGDVNHWGGWQVERDAWRHVEPIAQQLSEDLTAAFLIPTLIAEGHADPYRFVVQYDAAEILTNPDRSDDAKTALELGAIGYAAYRDATGWSEDDAPDEEDLAWRQQWESAGGSSGFGGASSDPAAGGSPSDTSPSQVEPSAPPEDHPAEGDAITASAARLSLAANMQVIRYREMAGARIRSRLQRDPQALASIADVPNQDVAAVVGAAAAGDPVELIRQVGPTPFGAAAIASGVDGRVVEAVEPLILRHASRTLFAAEPPPFPEATIAAMLERV